jgi:predicted KAP-like P-loop ATPase
VKLRAPKIEISTDDPFKYDLLDRKASVHMLTEIIKSTDEALVIGIDAEWGQGKSTFVNMWGQYLESHGFKKLNFNAWESDFSNDALVSLIGELELGMEKLSTTNNNKAERALKKAKNFGLTLIKRAIPVGVKLATAGLFNLSDFSEEALAELGEKLAEEKIKSYEDAKKSVQTFRSALEEEGINNFV